jgi:hypothetical protein
MQSELWELLLSTDNESITKKRKKRSAKSETEKEKAKLERKLWELAEEYEDDC